MLKKEVDPVKNKHKELIKIMKMKKKNDLSMQQEFQRHMNALGKEIA